MIQHQQSLIKQHVDGLSPGALDHEVGARLAEHRRSIADDLAGVRFDAQVDVALRIGGRSTLRDQGGRRAEALRG